MLKMRHQYKFVCCFAVTWFYLLKLLPPISHRNIRTTRMATGTYWQSRTRMPLIGKSLIKAWSGRASPFPAICIASGWSRESCCRSTIEVRSTAAVAQTIEKCITYEHAAEVQCMCVCMRSCGTLFVMPFFCTMFNEHIMTNETVF